MSTPRPGNPLRDEPRPTSNFLRRSMHAMVDRLSPFSSSALASLPNPSRPARYTRADGIPDIQSADTESTQQPTISDYHAINSNVRVPKKIPTSIKVEGKVWFANERTWISWLNISVLIGALALALFNASQDPIARWFAYAYAAISVAVLVYGYWLYQRRITMIRRRDPGHFDMVAGPLLVSAALFCAILANFLIRVHELQQKNIPIPGAGLWFSLTSKPLTVFNATSL